MLPEKFAKLIVQSNNHSNNKELFDYLYETYAAALYGSIIKWADNESLAQTILLEAFTKFFSAYVSGRVTGRPFIEMLKIARECLSSTNISSTSLADIDTSTLVVCN